MPGRRERLMAWLADVLAGRQWGATVGNLAAMLLLASALLAAFTVFVLAAAAAGAAWSLLRQSIG